MCYRPRLKGRFVKQKDVDEMAMQAMLNEPADATSTGCIVDDDVDADCDGDDIHYKDLEGIEEDMQGDLGPFQDEAMPPQEP